MCTDWYTVCMDDNRSRLLAKALDLFTQRGYDAVGVQEVAEAAGVKKPTLYHYFGSKSGLLKVILEENYAGFITDLCVASTYHRDVVTTLVALVKTYFQFAQEHRQFYRFQLSTWFSPPESEAFRAIAAINQEQQDLLEAFFRRAAQDHGNMRGREGMYAATFLGMINTYISLWLNGSVVLDDELTGKVVHQFMHGIFS